MKKTGGGGVAKQSYDAMRLRLFPEGSPVQPDPAPSFCPVFDSESRQDTGARAKVCHFHDRMEVPERILTVGEKLYGLGEIRRRSRNGPLSNLHRGIETRHFSHWLRVLTRSENFVVGCGPCTLGVCEFREPHAPEVARVQRMTGATMQCSPQQPR